MCHGVVTPFVHDVGIIGLGRTRSGSGSPVSRSNSSGLSLSGRTFLVSLTHPDNTRLMSARTPVYFGSPVRLTGSCTRLRRQAYSDAGPSDGGCGRVEADRASNVPE
jgi:hypothetical protein